jgi:hypothetical protein
VIGILLDGHWRSSEFTFENPTPFTLKCIHNAVSPAAPSSVCKRASLRRM